MKKLDKKIFETLMNIKKGCINLTSIYGSCEGCPFNIGDMCIMEELGNELACQPYWWTEERIKELIEL